MRKHPQPAASGTATCGTTATWNLRSLFLKDAVWSQQNQLQKMQRGKLWVGGLLKEPLAYMSNFKWSSYWHNDVTWSCMTLFVEIKLNLLYDGNWWYDFQTSTMQQVGHRHCLWRINMSTTKPGWCSIIVRTMSQLWEDYVFKPDLISQVCHGRSCRFRNIPHRKIGESMDALS